MPKKLIIGIIVVVVLIVGGYFVFSKKVVNPAVNEQQNSLEAITTTVNDISKNDITSLDDIWSTGNWPTFETPNGYKFMYPTSWERSGNQFLYNGKQVAILECPITDIGYEAWNFSVSESRSYSKGNHVYVSTLRLGKGSPDLGDLGIILMYWNPDDNLVSNWEKNKDSCRLRFYVFDFSNEASVRRIFNSVF